MLIFEAEKKILFASNPVGGFRVLGHEASAQFNFEFVERPFIERSKPLSGLDTDMQAAPSSGRALCILPTFSAANHLVKSNSSEVQA
jgi:hypothetical protein